MGDWKPTPLPDGSYADPSRPFSDQDVVGYWAEYASGPGTRSRMKLVQLPGLKPFADLGAGPHRGIRNVEGELFVVCDTHAYKIATDGTGTRLGTIPGRGRVWISHNQNDSGAVRQVMFSTGPEGWIWDKAAETFTQISDDAFHGARSLIYLNSRFLGIEQQRRYFANSALADGTQWDSTETYQAESSPDRLVALVAFAGEVLAFNESTLEFFQNTTSAEDEANHIYFTRVGPPVQIGAASAHAVSVLDNRVFFLGSDGAPYYMNGYSPVRIGTSAIEKAFQDCDLSKAFAFTYVSRGHSVWYLTFPDGMTWGYDCATQKWHRRQTIGLDRWRLNTLCQWNGLWVGGAYNSGLLYTVDWDYHLEGCDELVREFTTGVLHDEGNRVSLDGLRIECDTGNALSSCQSVTTQVFAPDQGDMYVASMTGVSCPAYYKVNLNTDAVTTSGPDTDAFLNGWVNRAGTGMWGVSTPGLAFGFYTFATDTFTVLNSAHTYGLFVVDSTQTYAYVLSEFPTSILYKIALATGTIIDSEAFFGQAINPVLHPSGTYVYAHGYTSAEMGVYNIATGAMVTVSMGVYNQCRDSCLSADATYFFSVCSDSGSSLPILAKFTTASLPTAPAVIDSVQLPEGCSAVRCHPNGLSIAACNYDNVAGKVYIYDTATLTGPPVTINVGQKPHFLMYTADGSKLYAINYASNNASVIDTQVGSATVNTVIATISLPVAPGRPTLVPA